jgi:hypothetical protein
VILIGLILYVASSHSVKGDTNQKYVPVQVQSASLYSGPVSGSISDSLQPAPHDALSIQGGTSVTEEELYSLRNSNITVSHGK